MTMRKIMIQTVCYGLLYIKKLKICLILMLLHDFTTNFVTVQPSFPTFIKPDSNFYIKKIYSYVLLSAAALQLLFYSLRE